MTGDFGFTYKRCNLPAEAFEELMIGLLPALYTFQQSHRGSRSRDIARARLPNVLGNDPPKYRPENGFEN